MPGGASGQGKRHHGSDWLVSIHLIPKKELVRQALSTSALIGWTAFVLVGLVDRPGTGSFLQRLLYDSVDTSTSFFLSPVVCPARAQVALGLVSSFISPSIFHQSQCVVR